jgi:hypothetical protein
MGVFVAVFTGGEVEVLVTVTGVGITGVEVVVGTGRTWVEVGQGEGLKVAVQTGGVQGNMGEGVT